jgi:DNA-binding transcriptional ArsR family regulator
MVIVEFEIIMAVPSPGSGMTTTEAVIDREGTASAAGEPPGWDTVAELPASAKLVARTLEYEGPLTGQGLAEETRLPPRTVRYAVGRLEEAGAVSVAVSLRDAREKRYQLRID